MWAMSVLAGAVAEEPVSEGFWLAWVAMALLFLALAYALGIAVWLALGREVPVIDLWDGRLIPILAVAGLGVALYLTYVETTNTQAVCGPVGNCNEVQASPFAKLFGVLPVGLLGAVGYVAILAAWAFGRFGKGTWLRLAPFAILGMTLFGVLFSIYLTYLELFIIRAGCIWCVTSAVI
ncbi:MAG: vitamin K epoxide reductase family protein, partial [Anaerolineae bacterium]|nr:vitamin K epoxide reductase family protein [Anaerolineae bacterium]